VGEKCSDKFRLRIRLPRNSRDLLHAANLRHGTDGFTTPPKEGVLKIFSPLKIRRLRPGLHPRTWVPKASTLPLEHRSRCFVFISGQTMTFVLHNINWLVFKRVHNIVKGFIMSVCPFAWNNSALTGWIFMKFDSS